LISSLSAKDNCWPHACWMWSHGHHFQRFLLFHFPVTRTEPLIMWQDRAKFTQNRASTPSIQPFSLRNNWKNKEKTIEWTSLIFWYEESQVSWCGGLWSEVNRELLD
jgi:hypothetical protein